MRDHRKCRHATLLSAPTVIVAADQIKLAAIPQIELDDPDAFNAIAAHPIDQSLLPRRSSQISDLCAKPLARGDYR